MSIHVCDHCGKPIPDDASVCPHCGETISEDIRLTRIPETIGELQEFCAAHKMPLDAMRFFIGEDFRGARAFGIYKDENGNCVVYKNKSDGSRAVRYEGPDEKRAVREIYEKLKSETDLRRRADARRAPAQYDPERYAEPEASDDEPPKPWALVLGGILYFWKPIVIVLAAAALLFFIGRKPDRGYYRYQDDTYYYQSGDWYRYDDYADGWEPYLDVPADLTEHYDDYYESEDYGGVFGVPDFSGSGWYDEDDEYDEDDGWSLFDDDSSYDSYDWDDGGSDYDSWDSFDTDWDSDW